MSFNFEETLKRRAKLFKLETSCVGCVHFNRKKEECNRYSVRPPVEILILACDNFEEDIPF